MIVPSGSYRLLCFFVVFVFDICLKFCHTVFVLLRVDTLWTVFRVLATTFVEEETVLDGCAFSAARMYQH